MMTRMRIHNTPIPADAEFCSRALFQVPVMQDTASRRPLVR